MKSLPFKNETMQPCNYPISILNPQAEVRKEISRYKANSEVEHGQRRCDNVGNGVERVWPCGLDRPTCAERCTSYLNGWTHAGVEQLVSVWTASLSTGRRASRATGGINTESAYFVCRNVIHTYAYTVHVQTLRPTQHKHKYVHRNSNNKSICHLTASIDHLPNPPLSYISLILSVRGGTCVPPPAHLDVVVVL